MMKKTCNSTFTALNVKLRIEPVATDIVYCDASAMYDGSKCTQVFVDTKTLVSDVYGMKHDKQIVNSLEHGMRQRGAIDKLLSDIAQSKIITKVKKN